jgi:hypothetical protein
LNNISSADAVKPMSELDIQTEMLIALSILAWMVGLYTFDTIQRRRREKREAWKKDSERRWT